MLYQTDYKYQQICDTCQKSCPLIKMFICVNFQVRLKDGRTIEVIGGTQRAELGSTGTALNSKVINSHEHKVFWFYMANTLLNDSSLNNFEQRGLYSYFTFSNGVDCMHLIVSHQGAFNLINSTYSCVYYRPKPLDLKCAHYISLVSVRNCRKSGSFLWDTEFRYLYKLYDIILS